MFRQVITRALGSRQRSLSLLLAALMLMAAMPLSASGGIIITNFAPNAYPDPGFIETQRVESELGVGANFANDIDIDGDVAVVGHYNYGVAGAIEVFLRNGTAPDHTWTNIAQIVGDPSGPKRFGFSVAVDNDLIVVGAPATASSSGVAYLYEVNRETQGVDFVQALIPAADIYTDSDMGYSVDIAGDIIAVGVPKHDWVWTGEERTDTGIVLTYKKDVFGEFVFDQWLSMGWGGGTDNYFGFDLALHANDEGYADMLAVGMPRYDSVWNYDGAWAKFERSSASGDFGGPHVYSDAGSNYLSGSSVALESTSQVLLGSPGRPSGGALLSNNLNPAGGYTAVDSAPSDVAAGDEFGADIALSNGTALVASPFDDDIRTDRGSVWVYEVAESGALTAVQKIMSHDATQNAGFGSGVAIEGDYAAIGASAETASNGLGAAHFYYRPQYKASYADGLTVNKTYGVLANDWDPDGDTLSAHLSSTTSNGTLNLNSNGSFTYDPDAHFTGADSFKYYASDSNLNSSVVTATIVVNVPPTAADDEATTNEEEALGVAAPGLLANDSDTDGDTFTEIDVVAEPEHGTVDVTTSGEDLGTWIYTPKDGFVGTDSFTYRAFDGYDYSNIATVEITVKDVLSTGKSVQGATRFDTAIEASRESFPEGLETDIEGYKSVVLATGRNWPDALGGASLAGALEAPILLTDTYATSDAVKAEISRLGADRVIIVGGTGAVSENVKTDLGSLYTVERIGGADRFATARMLADRTVEVQSAKGIWGTDGVGIWGTDGAGIWGTDGAGIWGTDGCAIVATAKNFPDALAGSPMSSARGFPVYLAGSSGIDSTTLQAIVDSGAKYAIILGGTGAVPESADSALSGKGLDVTRLAGTDRYSTAVEIAKFGVEEAYLDWDGVALATGQNFPDALAGGVMAGQLESVLMLTRADSLPKATSDTLTEYRSAIYEMRFLGGEGAISPSVRSSALSLLR